MMKSRLLLLLIAMLLLVAGVVVLYFSFKSPPKNPLSRTVPVSSDAMMIEGKIDCLPHKNTGGGTTLECTYGLKTDKGEYYGLQNASGLGALFQTDVNHRVRITGKSSSQGTQLTQYNIIGILEVQNVEVLQN